MNEKALEQRETKGRICVTDQSGRVCSFASFIFFFTGDVIGQQDKTRRSVTMVNELLYLTQSNEQSIGFALQKQVALSIAIRRVTCISTRPIQ